MNTPARPLTPPDARGAAEPRAAEDIETVRARAALLESRKELEEAARCWQQFLERHPADAAAANELGGVLMRMERFEDALRWLSRALEIRPGLIAAKAQAGLALRQLKRFEEAAATFKDVLASAPDDAAVGDVFGTLSVRVGMMRTASGIRPRLSAATCRIFVCRPCPISVPPWLTCTLPSR